MNSTLTVLNQLSKCYKEKTHVIMSYISVVNNLISVKNLFTLMLTGLLADVTVYTSREVMIELFNQLSYHLCEKWFSNSKLHRFLKRADCTPFFPGCTFCLPVLWKFPSKLTTLQFWSMVELYGQHSLAGASACAISNGVTVLLCHQDPKQ